MGKLTPSKSTVKESKSPGEGVIKSNQTNFTKGANMGQAGGKKGKK
ncbi:hypothetical protein LCGC14_2712960 [marine sediment metagenome]|uniref:Uncharacterized protein n=1 Tax=marine sediment metagenome TaxID=412755 RepID=A0A0F8ZCC9_9ZZZZ